MRYVLLLALLLSLVFAGRPNKQQKHGKRASYGLGALFSPAAVVDKDGFYHYTHEAKRDKVTEEHDPLRFMKLKTKLHPTAFFVDKEEEVNEVLCEAPNVLTVRFSKPIPARWGVGDLVFGDEDWGCVNDKNIIAPLARRILEVRTLESREWTFITESVAPSLAFEEADASLSIQPGRQVKLDFLDKAPLDLPKISVGAEGPSTHTKHRAIQELAFESPQRNLFMTEDKISVNLPVSASDGTSVQLRVYIDIRFYPDSYVTSASTTVKNSAVVHEFLVTSAWEASNKYYIEATISGTTVESERFSVNYPPKIVVTDPYSSSVFKPYESIIPAWVTAPELQGKQFSVTLYIDIPNGLDEVVGSFTATADSPPQLRVNPNMKASTKYYWFIGYNCWTNWLCTYSAESQRFTVLNSQDTEPHSPVITFPPPRTTFSIWNMSVSYDWVNPPLSAELVLKRNRWGPDETIFTIPFSPQDYPSGFSIINVPALKPSTQYYYRLEYDCGFSFPSECVRESTYFSIAAPRRVQWPDFGSSQKFQVTDSITVHWSYTEQISTPVFLSLVKLIPVINEHIPIVSIPGYRQDTLYTLPAGVLEEGTIFPVFWMISYNCQFEFENIGYFCTNELSPSFSIPFHYLQDWNYDYWASGASANPIVLHEGTTNSGEDPLVTASYSLDCVDCYILNDIEVMNVTLTLSGGTVSSVTADFLGTLVVRFTPRLKVTGEAKFELTKPFGKLKLLYGPPLPLFYFGIYFQWEYVLKATANGEAEVGLVTKADAAYSMHYRSDSQTSSLDSFTKSIDPYFKGSANIDAFIGLRPTLSVRAEVYENGPGMVVKAGPVIGVGAAAALRFPAFPGNDALDYPVKSLFHFGNDVCKVDHHMTLDTTIRLYAEIEATKSLSTIKEPQTIASASVKLTAVSLASGCFLPADTGCAVDCNDNDECTVDFCSNATCQHTPKICPPAPQCQIAFCDLGNCFYSTTPGANCTDGNFCTVEDQCSADGTCVGIPRDCNDNNPCTTDTCSNGVCVHTALSGACDDGDLCTENDMCLAGICKGTLKVCSDFNQCTVDTCENGVCKSVASNSSICSDNDPCTRDVCSNGQCLSTPLQCPSGDCYSGTCVNGLCTFTEINENGACDDGQAETINDKCVLGDCIGEALHFTNDVDYVGNAIKLVTTSSSVECDEYCRFTTYCDCWAYAPATTQCTLMSPCPKPVQRDPTYLGGIVSGKRLCDDFINFDFTLDGIQVVAATSPTTCRALCLDSGSCLTWTFMPETGSCSINSGASLTLRDDAYLGGVTSGFKIAQCPPFSTEYPIHHIYGAEFAGTNLGTPIANVYTSKDCEVKCREDAACACWAYDPFFYSCQLKSTCTDPVAVDTLLVSGKLSCDVLPRIDFIGTVEMQNSNTTTAVECQALCQQSSSCVTWGFSTPDGCTLRSDFQYSVVRLDASFVGGIKDCSMFLDYEAPGLIFFQTLIPARKTTISNVTDISKPLVLVLDQICENALVPQVMWEAWRSLVQMCF